MLKLDRNQMTKTQNQSLRLWKVPPPLITQTNNTSECIQFEKATNLKASFRLLELVFNFSERLLIDRQERLHGLGVRKKEQQEWPHIKDGASYWVCVSTKSHSLDLCVLKHPRSVTSSFLPLRTCLLHSAVLSYGFQLLSQCQPDPS